MLVSLPLKWASAIFIVAIMFTLFVVNSEVTSSQQLAQSQALETLSRYRSDIQKAITSRFNQALALEAFVKSHTDEFTEAPDKSHTQFRYFVSSLQSSVPGILSLQLAPDGIIKYVTNEEKNAKIIGYDLFKDDNRRRHIINTVKQRTIIVAGPVTLLQGGNAFIARKAIFTHPDTFQPKDYIKAGRAEESSAWLKDIPSDFWGFSTVLIDANQLYDEVFANSLSEGVKLALRGRHGLGHKGEVFWGDPDIFDSPTASTEILLPGGSWILAIKLERSDNALIIFLIGLIVSLIAANAVYVRQHSIEIDMMSKARAGFLASMSHELRTPMNGVLGMSELLKDTDLNEQQQSYLNHILSCSRTLLLLIDDILDVTKISTNNIVIESCEFNPREVIQHSLMSIQAQAQKKELTVFQNIHPDFPKLCIGDPTRLQQVLTNLLSNAVKFTEHGEVSIRAELSNQGPNQLIKITVSDTGIGIAHSQQKRIFEAFTQADETVTRLHGGSGLGMMISKNLMTLMKGTLSLKSDLNKGTTVTVELPYIPVLITASNDLIVESAIEENEKKETEQHGNAETAAQSNLKILVVDDVALNREITTRLLQKVGYSADTAIDGQQAVTQHKEQHYDLIFMDRHMPVMDGITATEFIRSQSNNMKKPWIIALSASALDEEREQCLTAGMNDYLSKPVNAEALRLKIEEYLARKT